MHLHCPTFAEFIYLKSRWKKTSECDWFFTHLFLAFLVHSESFYCYGNIGPGEPKGNFDLGFKVHLLEGGGWNLSLQVPNDEFVVATQQISHLGDIWKHKRSPEEPHMFGTCWRIGGNTTGKGPWRLLVLCFFPFISGFLFWARSRLTNWSQLHAEGMILFLQSVDFCPHFLDNLHEVDASFHGLFPQTDFFLMSQMRDLLSGTGSSCP